jgi:tetratricopeptide (TPR) repeat protein
MSPSCSRFCYNPIEMCRPPLVLSAVLFASVSMSLVAARLTQNPPGQSGAKTPSPGASSVFLVFPFENSSRSVRDDWLGEGLEELTIERLAAAGLHVFSHEERLAELERYSLPPAGRYSRAMMLRLAEDLDADFVLFGSYTTDGKTLGLDARLLRVRPPALLQPAAEVTPLDGLLDAQLHVIWRLISTADSAYPLSLAEFSRRQRPLRLDAFEHYIRGLLATEDEQKIRSLREAARLEPGWSAPAIALGQVYFARRDCAEAVSWLGRNPSTGEQSLEAGFLTGVCHLFQNQAERAETVFQSLEDGLRREFDGAYELPEILNNLAVAEGRLGKPALSEPLLERARRLDPDDGDYGFNLALLKLRAKNPAAAIGMLREVIAREPEDVEARALLVSALERSGQGEAAAAERAAAAEESSGKPLAPLKPEALAHLDRIKTHLDSSVLKLAAASGSGDAAAATSPAGPAANGTAPSHARLGRQLLSAGKLAEAEREFHAALASNPNDAGAHQGLAEVYRRQGRADDAVAELRAALNLRETAAARTDLARLYLDQQKPDLARPELERALQLAPGYAPARQLLPRLQPSKHGGTKP